ncbi:hypothetical protein Cs7R123_26290 [Catellatospora sp. TT07R-123]|uniref:hypothetical protein n=1 Tax=Catellatospora sp. TT07R-123 TaxID=2733863 RepID=UPI001B148CD9|nr:hypothetical protein [Catellatospora sp. TT07R-123]GHJ45287.1 hypothetical protein Cs7R123_26290 [Catellatospora sp. TT07R-123]
MAFQLFKGRRVLPPALRPQFDRSERVLAWAPCGDGVVVATNLGLWWDGARTGWHRIDKAAWDGTVMVITTAAVAAERAGYEVVADAAPVRLPLTDPDHLPHQVHLRVTSSVRHPVHHEVPGGGLWVFARRVPGMDGLAWTVRYDEGTDPDSPAVAAATDQLVAAAQNDL